MIQETPIQETPVIPYPNPWKEIWFRPQSTIRAIIKRDSEHHVIDILAALLGISFFWWRTTDVLQFNIWGLVNTLAVIGIGTIVGMFYIVISSLFFGWVGRLLGGVATNQEMCAAIAWASIPQIFTIPIPYLSILVKHTFLVEISDTLGLGLMSVFIIWGIVLTMATFVEVHQVSIFQSLIALILLLSLLIVIGWVFEYVFMFWGVVFSPAI